MASVVALIGSILAGLAGAAVTHGLARATARAAAPVRRGWKRLQPGALHWAGLGLSGGLVGLMGWIGLFIGSSRPDATFQMRVLWGLVALFSAGGLACLWQVRAICHAQVAWRGRQIAFAGDDGAPVIRGMDAVTAVETRLLSAVRVVFADGTVLRVDPYATGAADLLDRIQGGG